MSTPYQINNRSALKPIPDKPPVHTLLHRSSTFFDDHELECSESRNDTFRIGYVLEHFAPDVRVLFIGSMPFLERNLVITLLDSRLSCSCETKTNIDRAWCEQLNSRPMWSGSISLSIVYIVSDRFPNRTENQSV